MGQTDPSYGFVARGPGTAILLKPNEILLRLGDTAEIAFRGANPEANGELRNRQPGRSHAFTARGAQVGGAIYGGLLYHEVYPGIDLSYHTRGRLLEYDFIVAPGADPRSIRIGFSADGGASIDADGGIRLALPSGELYQTAPRIYQESPAGPVPVQGGYVQTGAGEFAFLIDEFDHSRPLIIDPVIGFSGYWGGSGQDAITAMALDASGYIYVTGWTNSLDFPAANGYQTSMKGAVDVFVSKIDPFGNAVLYSTYLGGRWEDRALGIAVDASGSAVITGWTASPDFPIANAARSLLYGSRNAFVTRLNAAGNGLVFSTYLGGGAEDMGNAVALDPAGNVYVAGTTNSFNFPVLSAAQGTNHGQHDAFVAKFSAGGTLLYSTFLGGYADDSANAIAVDPAGYAYITGGTFSPDFPVLNPLQSASGGGQDVFVAKLGPSGQSLLFSTYLGGSGGAIGQPESGAAIVLDGAGNLYVAGTTSSTNFPVSGAFQPANAGGPMDGFITKMNTTGSARLWSTYLGGVNADFITAAALDAGGGVCVAGYTISKDFPLVSPIQSSNLGLYNAFVTRVASSGSAITFSTYLGGESSDSANAVAVDSAGNIYLAGLSLSYRFPTNGLQVLNPSGYGGFLAKLQTASSYPPAVVSSTPSSGSGSSQTFAFQFSDQDGYGAIDSAWFDIYSSSNNPQCLGEYVKSRNALYLMNDNQTAWIGPLTPGISGTLQNSACTINGSQSSVTGSGSLLTWNVSLTFPPAFAGPKAISLFATAGTLNSSWSAAAVWTVPGGATHAPVAVSSTPSSGSGTSQVFAFQFSEQDGYSGIDQSWFDIYGGGSAQCLGYFSRNANAFYLMNDSQTAWLGPLTPGGSGSLQNATCSLDAAGSSVSGSGTLLTMRASLTFQAAWAGSKYISLMATAGSLTSNWACVATWSVGAGVTHAPTVVSATPSSGSGMAQSFSFVFSEQDGYAGIEEAWTDIYSNAASPQCLFIYRKAANAIYLMNDNQTAWLGPLAVGGSGTIQTSSCAISAAGLSVSGSGTKLTLNIPVTFLPAFVGSKSISLYATAASGSLSSGWVGAASWTVR